MSQSQRVASAEPVTIRQARSADEKALAALAFSTYYRRYFDQNARGPRGERQNKLSDDFPELAPESEARPGSEMEPATGQSRRSFEEYWAKFMLGIDAPDPRTRSYCFVAEAAFLDGSQKIVGFVKGTGEPLDAQMSKLWRYRRQASDSPRDPATAGLVARDIAELGSVYIDENWQRQQIGERLTSAYGAAMRQLGYKAMITRCWSKNDSPRFFGKMGAVQQGACAIPISYYRASRDESGSLREIKAETVIPGVWLLWPPEALDALAGQACRATQANGASLG